MDRDKKKQEERKERNVKRFDFCLFCVTEQILPVIVANLRLWKTESDFYLVVSNPIIGKDVFGY